MAVIYRTHHCAVGHRSTPSESQYGPRLTREFLISDEPLRIRHISILKVVSPASL